MANTSSYDIVNGNRVDNSTDNTTYVFSPSEDLKTFTLAGNSDGDTLAIDAASSDFKVKFKKNGMTLIGQKDTPSAGVIIKVQLDKTDGGVDHLAFLDGTVDVSFEPNEPGSVKGKWTFGGISGVKKLNLGAENVSYEIDASKTFAQAEAEANASQNSQTFTLTDGVDSVVGTSGNDTVAALVDAGAGTYSLLDTIDTGAGIDTMNLITTAAAVDDTDIAAAENLEVVNLDARADLALSTISDIFTAMTTLNLTNKTHAYTLTGLDFDTTTSVKLTATGDNVSATGAGEIANVTLAGVTAGSLDVDGTAAADATTVNLTVSSASEAGDLDANNATELNITASADLTLATVSAAAVTDINITGAGNVDLGSVATAAAGALATIDASAATGDISVTGLAGDETVLTGSGDDTIGVVGSVNVDGIANEIDGGTGVNTLSVTLDDAANAFTDATGVSNIQKLSLTTTAGGDDIAADLDGLSGLTEVKMVAVNAADTLTISNLVAQTVVVDSATALATLTIGLADDSATDDEVNVTVNNSTNDGTDGGETTTTLSDLVATNVETINLALTTDEANFDESDTVVVAKVSTTAAALVITGNAQATLGGGTALTNTDIDASAATGALTINLGAADQDVTTGSGDDTIVIGANGDANDTVDGGDGDDTMTVTVASAATEVSAVTTNVETVEVTMTLTQGNNVNVTDTFDASNLVGADITLIQGAVTGEANEILNNLNIYSVTNLQVGAGVTLEGNFISAEDTATVSLALETATGTTDSLTVTLSSGNGNTTADEAVTQGVEALSINDIETVSFVLDDGDDAGVTTITTLSMDDAKTINLSGDAGLVIAGSTVANVTTVNMGSFTGGFNLTIANGATYNLGVIGDGVEAAANIDTDESGANDANVSELTLVAGERDVLKFTDLSNSLVVNGVEGGGDISDDDFNFSAISGLTFADLTFTDGDWDDSGAANDVAITSTEFDGVIYLVGVTSADINQADFIFA